MRMIFKTNKTTTKKPTPEISTMEYVERKGPFYTPLVGIQFGTTMWIIVWGFMKAFHITQQFSYAPIQRTQKYLSEVFVHGSAIVITNI